MHPEPLPNIRTTFTYEVARPRVRTIQPPTAIPCYPAMTYDPGPLPRADEPQIVVRPEEET